MDIAQVAPWLAFVAAAWNAGVTGARFRSGLGLTRVMEAGLMFAAAVAIIGWATWLGALIADAPGAEPTPLHVDTLYRVATVWSMWRGMAMTLATAMLTLAALEPALSRDGARLTRQAFLRSLVGVVLLAPVAADLLPATVDSLPAFVQSRAAALAPLAALASVALLLTTVTAAGVTVVMQRRLLALAWLGATVALGAEQVARAELGIGPRDPIVLGSASSGLALWLLTSALLHARVVGWVFRQQTPVRPAGSWAGRMAHAGAVLVVASFAAHVFAARTTVDLPPGVPVGVTDAFGAEWRLVNQGVSTYDDEGADVTALAVEATPAGGTARLLTTERRQHRAFSGGALPSSRRGATGRWLMTLRVLLEVAERDDLVRVRITFLPLPVLWDAGMLLLLVGAMLTLSSSQAYVRQLPKTPDS